MNQIWKSYNLTWIALFILIFVPMSESGIYNRLFGNLTDSVKQEVMENEDIGPHDHLDAVRFERDGHLNPEFRYEIFLGEEKHKFEKESDEVQIKKLKEIFEKADENSDSFIDDSELHNWIMKMVNSHMEQAKIETEEKFDFVDRDKSSDATFTEFIEAFMTSLRKTNSSHEFKFTPNYIAERLKTIKNEWKKADLDDDGILSRKEFLFFQHPEMSSRSLTIAVEEFLAERDYDLNGKLDVKEFAFGFPVGSELEIEDYMAGDELLKDKIHQFNVFLDKNNDSFATPDELREYLDPFSTLNARNDALDMIFFVDENQDGKLSLKEVLQSSKYLTGTKLYDASSYFHSEL